MALSREQLIEAIKEMNVLELSQLVKDLEGIFGVSAAAPVAAAAPTAAAAVAEAVEEQTEFDVILESSGAEKIKVIKVVREITSLGLKEAKDLVDTCPNPIKTAVPKAEAEAIKAKLTEVGATIKIK